MAGIVTLPHHPERSHVDDGRSFPRRHPFAFASLAMAIAGLVVLALYLGAYFAVRDMNPLGGLDGLVQGGNEASMAAGFATSEGLTYGQLTQTELQARYPKTHWVLANIVSTPSHGGVLNVSTSISGDHIIMAVAENAGSCSWGLAVQSSSDPIIVSDRLSGPGVYWTITLAAPAQSPGGNPPCEAAAAPASTWNPLGPEVGTNTGR
jgi:hypothetical protein